jgi:predicted metalloendopeptidase
MGIHSSVVALSLLLASSPFLRVNALPTRTLSEASLNSMLDWMDPTVDPCDDFYQYACGNFLKQHANPARSIGAFDIVDERITTSLNNLFKDIDNSDKPAEHPFAKVHRYYQSCMAPDEEESLYNLQFMINQALGNNSLDTLEGRSKAWALAHSQGVHSVFKLTVGHEILDAKNAGLFVMQPDLGMRLESFKKKAHLDAYLAYIEDLFKATSQYITNQPSDVAQLVFSFESALAAISLTDDEQEDIEQSNKKTAMSDFKSIVGKWIDFEDVLKTLQVNVAVDYVTLNPPEYFTELAKLLENTPADTLKWYTTWTFMRTYASFLPMKFSDIRDNFTAKVRGTFVKRPRNEVCAKASDVAMGLTLAELMFPEFRKEDVETMISYLRTSFQHVIEQTEWLDEETRSKALLKLAAIRSDKVAFPDFIHDLSKLQEYYRWFDVEMNYFENGVNMNTWKTANDLAQLQNGIDPNAWSDTPITVNAYYVGYDPLP